MPLRSFRDPAGSVLLHDERVFRVVHGDAASTLRQFLASSIAAELLQERKIVRTSPVIPGDPAWQAYVETAGMPEENCALLEHERIRFPSFPYEWSPAMLHAAALLTLELAQRLLPLRYGLKDATPFNILFRGPEPVFVDLLSFDQRADGDPAWLAYAQFLQTFTYPLLVNRVRGMPLAQIFQSDRDGVTPEATFKLMGMTRAILPPWLWLLAAPVLLHGRTLATADLYTPRRTSPEQAAFVLNRTFRSLQNALRRCAPREAANSDNIQYRTTGHNYSPDDSNEKEEFVQDALRQCSPKSVIDVGCNTGHFSSIAARAGAQVVSIDRDPEVVDVVWRRSKLERLDILPLAINLAAPPPATGWRNGECPAFLERAAGHFDFVLMLAIVHHLLVTERIPLEEIFDLASRLTTGHLLIEYVDPADSQFQRMLRGRGALHSQLSRQAFESASAARFQIVNQRALTSGIRVLYLMRKRLR